MIKDYMEVLDKRICDVEENADNTETYREFINDSCDYFGIVKPILNTSEEVKDWIDFLDNLWDK